MCQYIMDSSDKIPNSRNKDSGKPPKRLKADNKVGSQPSLSRTPCDSPSLTAGH